MSPETMVHIRDGVLYLVALILSICVHEFGHAYVADKLGDPLPRAQGRVTLNPLAHIDPVGTILLPIIAFASGSFIGARVLGWGKPVEVSLSARSITRKVSIATADILISVAGPVMNILFAMLLSGVFVALLKWGGSTGVGLAQQVAAIVGMNFGLAMFNLLPIPPLDGGHIATRLTSSKSFAETLTTIGPYLLFGLLMMGLLGRLTAPARWLAVAWLQMLAGWIS